MYMHTGMWIGMCYRFGVFARMMLTEHGYGSS